ncbi:helicase C-terminal domain-containing protein [Thalassotalea piscium]|uniref:ATP-dependent DNA helicase DinG n=1 Tax=Thalassotalea piscium TaxID=1230533 RepID=A0A7X0TTI1_9GAMM|nr:helicase C-terminal domain-containing protein [Thalassotalea piscium]MBB6543149.1 ATP-dependent DNA helicase DinG [Thalassotalea piscium]
MKLSNEIKHIFNAISQTKVGYIPRDGQLIMSNQIANMLEQRESKVITIEGGTGCGKSLGYLIPTIQKMLQHNQNSTEQLSVVIATANVALQQQLIHSELPILEKAGLNFNVALAAGRGRYFCLSNAIKSLENTNFDTRETQLIEELIVKQGNENWDGLKDNLIDDNPILEQTWPKVSAQNVQCKKCPNHDNCPLIKARKAIDKANVIVANHALVWSDLTENRILPAPDKTIYVFDECHHIPKSFRDSLHKSLKLSSFAKLFEKDASDTTSIITSVVNMDEATPYISANEISLLMTNMKDGLRTLKNYAVFMIQQQQTINQSELVNVQFLEQDIDIQIRFEIDQRITPTIAQIIHHLESAIRWLNQQKKLSEQVKKELLKAMSLLRSMQQAYDTFVMLTQVDSTTPIAKWIANKSTHTIDPIFNSVYIETGHFLKENLFDKSHATILTSATLRTLGTFDRYLTQVGLTFKNTQLLCIQSPFNYKDNAILNITNSMPIPNLQNEKEHTESIVKKIKTDFKHHLGGLLLFSSKRQMSAFIEWLGDDILNHCKLQYTDSRQNLIARHKQDIDQGKKSLLIGCQSLSEGLDLPGEYLTYVGIAKIPFGDISSPIDNAEAFYCRKNNGNPFKDIMLPDACSRLIQSTGRLIRTMECKGSLAIYDSRLVNKQYGQLLLNTLPSYRVQVS